MPGVIEKLGIGPALEDARVFADWDRAMGEEIARVARPHRLDGATLIVLVKHSAWMNELALRRGDILERLNAGRQGRSLARIVFRLEG